ncbi:MAG: flippase-like domain-containing protein [Natronomonas sp.]
MATPEVSVILPAYNEAATLEETVESTIEALDAFLPPGVYEVLIAEDGCDDRTPEIATQLADEDEHIQHIHSSERLGRGGALEHAFEEADGDVLVYFDTDLATDLVHLEELVESIRSDDYDVATGSRRMPGRIADRPPKRGIASNGFNTLVRMLLRSEIRDHQCGFKAFDREALEAITDTVEDDHWFWDTEVLVRAQRAGYRIKEFPVAWEPKGDTKVDLVRDVLGMGSGVIRLWWQLSVSPRIDRRVTMTAGTLLVFVAIGLMTVYLDPSSVLSAMRDADVRYVAVAGVIYLLSWPIRGIRYRDILVELGYRERIGFLTGAIFISQTGNLVFPARAGDAIRAYIVKVRRNVPYPSGFASLAIERVFDLLTITMLAGVTLVALAAMGADLSSLGAGGAPEAGRESGRTAVYVAAGVGMTALTVVAAIVGTARSDRNLIRSTLGRLSTDAYVDRVATVIEHFAADVQTIARNRRSFALVGTTSVLVWTIDVATAIVVFTAFDISVPLTSLIVVGFFAVSVGNLAKVLPLSPGGIGLYEGAFSLLVVAMLPVGWGVAIAAAIVDHAVKNVVTLVGGIGSTLLYNVSLTTAVEESRDVEAEAPLRE